jgi:hypothetical protein
MTISCEIQSFLPLLQSGPRLPMNTQGSAKPAPWAKFYNRFAVENSHIARRVSYFSPVTSHLSPFFVVGARGAVGVHGVSLRMRAELKIERGTRRMGLRAEGVKDPPATLPPGRMRAGFSPGWRLCGTLGTDNKKRAALKERKNCSERRAIKAA